MTPSTLKAILISGVVVVSIGSAILANNVLDPTIEKNLSIVKIDNIKIVSNIFGKHKVAVVWSGDYFSHIESVKACIPDYLEEGSVVVHSTISNNGVVGVCYDSLIVRK